MLFWLIACEFQPNPSQSVWHHPRALNLWKKMRVRCSQAFRLLSWLYRTPRPLPRVGRRVPKKDKGAVKKIAPTATKKESFFFCGCWCNFFSPPPCLWYCCEKHFHSLDRSAVIGLITALAAARLGLWSADHDLRLGYEPTTLAKKIETATRTWPRRVICRACTRLLCLACVR